MITSNHLEALKTMAFKTMREACEATGKLDLAALIRHITLRGCMTHDYNGSIILDPATQVATFMIYNLSGQLVGYQRYNPHSSDKSGKDPETARYYTYMSPNTNQAWLGNGLSHDKGNVCFVVDGIFKATILNALGFNAVALFGSLPSKSALNWLTSLPYDLVAIGDNDKAGTQLVKLIGRGEVTEQDLDDMGPISVLKIANRYTQRGN